jgi:hypothetical protein
MVIPELGFGAKLDGQPGICGEVTKEYASISYLHANQRIGDSCFFGKFQEMNGKVRLVGSFKKTSGGIIAIIWTAYASIFALLVLFLVIPSFDFHDRADIGLALIIFAILSYIFLTVILVMKMSSKVNQSLIDQELKRILCS